MVFQYKDIYNFPQKVFDKAVETVEVEGESEAENEQDEEQEQELEKEMEMELEEDEREFEQDGSQYIEADSDDDEEFSMVYNKIYIIIYFKINNFFTYILLRRMKIVILDTKKKLNYRTVLNLKPVILR